MTIEELYSSVRDGKIISDIELQREIVYTTDKQQLVIDSIVKGIPLPSFYFWKREDGVLEVLDGKQRIESIKRFKENDIEYNGKLWRNTDSSIQKKINETSLSVIICEGSEEHKREIFRRINTLGVPLSKFEVLNGLFHGEYLRGLTSFVKNDRDVRKLLKTNTRGNNQYQILEFLKKIKKFNDIYNYVSENKDVSFETDQKVVLKYLRFITSIFDKYDSGLLQIEFELSMKYLKDITIWKTHKDEINTRIRQFLKSDYVKLISDKKQEIEDIIQTVVKGISVDNKRLFTREDKLDLLRDRECINGKYKCEKCQQLFTVDDLTVDHIIPWSLGGRTLLSNGKILCKTCNGQKGNRQD